MNYGQTLHGRLFAVGITTAVAVAWNAVLAAQLVQSETTAPQVTVQHDSDLDTLAARGLDGDIEAQFEIANISVAQWQTAKGVIEELQEQWRIQANQKPGTFGSPPPGSPFQQEIAKHDEMRAEALTRIEKWLPAAADAGHAEAQFLYAAYLLKQERLDDAVRWAYLGADSGSANAMNLVGWFHRHGLGVEEDQAKAFRWYTLAAENGSGAAMANVAMCRFYGRGTKQDKADALRWFIKSAEAGNVESWISAGIMYLEGDATEPSLSKAESAFRQAAAAAIPEAMYRLATIYTAREKHAEAFTLYERAATHGHLDSQCMTGNMYALGQGTGKNLSLALGWWETAARRGSAAARSNSNALVEAETINSYRFPSDAEMEAHREFRRLKMLDRAQEDRALGR